MEEIFQQVVIASWEKHFITDDAIAITRSSSKKRNILVPPKKRARKAKHECEAWLLQQQ